MTPKGQSCCFRDKTHLGSKRLCRSATRYFWDVTQASQLKLWGLQFRGATATVIMAQHESLLARQCFGGGSVIQKLQDVIYA